MWCWCQQNGTDSGGNEGSINTLIFLMVYVTCDEMFLIVCMKLDPWLEFRDDENKLLPLFSIVFLSTEPLYSLHYPLLLHPHPELITNSRRTFLKSPERHYLLFISLPCVQKWQSPSSTMIMVFQWKGKCPNWCCLSANRSSVSLTALEQDDALSSCWSRQQQWSVR